MADPLRTIEGNGDLSRFTAAARLLRQLCLLEPGQAYRLTATLLQDIQVPADPLDRQTPEYLVEFFKVRLPFFVVVRAESVRRFWDIYRPMPEEIERLMAQERLAVQIRSPNMDTARHLHFARACLLGARERLATFRRLGCLNSNDRELHVRAEDDFLCALDLVWEAQQAALASQVRRAA